MQDYFLSQFVDAFDTSNKWRVATIIKLQSDSISLSFDGWNAKWDETYPRNSSKIAPFRKFTMGYTGPPKKAIRTMNEAKIVEEIEKV